MHVLSLFDGISCGQVALHRAGIPITTYRACEIDPNAIKVTQHNFPETVQLGDVSNLSGVSCDLIMGGSPCQGFSKAGKNLGFADPRSMLLFDFIRLREESGAKWFLLENVKLKKADADLVSMLLGVEPLEICSSLFSAQKRRRSYWTNIPVAPIIDAGVEFWQIREWSGDHLKRYKMNRTPSRIQAWRDGKGNGAQSGGCPNVTYASKTNTLTTKQDRSPNAGLIEYEDFARYLTPLECERLQTLPDHYTASLRSRDKRYHAIGNGWTVDVIAHILKGIPQ